MMMYDVQCVLDEFFFPIISMALFFDDYDESYILIYWISSDARFLYWVCCIEIDEDLAITRVTLFSNGL